MFFEVFGTSSGMKQAAELDVKPQHPQTVVGELGPKQKIRIPNVHILFKASEHSKYENSYLTSSHKKHFPSNGLEVIETV